MEALSRVGIGPEPREVRLVFLFADVCRSTELLLGLGDHGAHRVMRAYRERTRAALAAHNGREVELRGDGVLAVFEREADALHFALETHGLPNRIGLHAGTALCDEGKYFGRNVVLAARLCDAARPGEVLVSESVRLSAGEIGSFSFGQPRLCALRGFESLERAFPVTPSALRARVSDRIAADVSRERGLARSVAGAAGG
jgi:class 3 adenylate cyclase